MPVRFAFQAELYGLTPAQRTSGAATVNAALDGEQVSDVQDRIVDPNKTVHGSVCLFVEADFAVRGSGDRIFTAARNWASTRAIDAADGRHSYVRLRIVDSDARTITQRYAESPGWLDTETNLPWSTLAA